MSERNVKGKHFVFLGGSHGMGRAAAMALAKRGASILIVGRGSEAGEAAVAQALQLGATDANFLPGDLSTIAGIRQVARGIQDWQGEISGMMHTAMAAFRNRIATEDNLDFASPCNTWRGRLSTACWPTISPPPAMVESFILPAMSVPRWRVSTSMTCNSDTANGRFSNPSWEPITWVFCIYRKPHGDGGICRSTPWPAAWNRSKPKPCRIRPCHW